MSKEQNWLFLQWLIPLAGVVITIMILFYSFNDKVGHEAMDQIKSETEAVVERYALTIDSDLKSIHTAGKTAAEILEQKKDMSGQMQQYLASLTDAVQVCNVFYCTEEGETLDQEGNTGTFPDVNTIPQNGHVFWREEQTGENYILEIRSVSQDAGRLIFCYPLDRISEMINVNLDFGGNAFLALIDREGEVLWSDSDSTASSFLADGNIWSGVDEEYVKEAGIARAKIRNTDFGSLMISASGESRLLAYAPIETNSWSVVVGISEEQVQVRKNEEWARVSSMLYKMMAVILVFAAVEVIINVVSRVKSFSRRKALEEKADTDLLTGLTNKLATEQKIKEYIHKNPNGKAMMLLLDIDNFKKINDTMGHAFGDEVLRALGTQIGTNFSVKDIIGRTGGDEFTLFIKNIKNEEDVLRQAQKLVYFFKGFQVGEYVKYSATASIGAAVFPDNGMDFESLYLSADKALYKAKERGKNQLAFYDDRDRK